MSSNYSHNAQIFLTTHSPAFIDLGNENQSVYLANMRNSKTIFTAIDEKERKNGKQPDQFLAIADELGHIHLMDELRARLSERLSIAEEAIKNRDALLSKLDDIRKPVVLTEGKTDALILNHAWRKLRGSEPPFEIKSCNVSDQEKKESAGANQLAICLKGIQKDNSKIVIGLFDRDEEGQNAFKDLGKNFVKINLFDDVRKSKNNKAYAVLLPLPKGFEKWEIMKNHCIEYMFPERTLNENGIILKAYPFGSGHTLYGDRAVSMV